MTAITDNWFARITKETLIRNPATPWALTWQDIAYNSVTTLNEKIDSIWGGGWGWDLSSNTAISVDGEVMLFSWALWKTAKRWNTLTWLYKMVSGIFTTATNADLPTMTATVGGAVPTPPNDSSKYLNGQWAFTVPAWGWDMVLASAQTNSGLKTFLDATFWLRNVANTFTSLFTNVATAARTWTLPDSNTIIPIISQLLTFSWPTTARTITLPDANFTVAKHDGSNMTLASQAIGDIITATSTSALGRLADVATWSVLVSGGVGVAPSYSATPLITSIDIWATDTTVARAGAWDISVEGNIVYRAWGTDVPVTDGGTWRSTSTTAYGLIAAGTTATWAHQTLAAGATTEILVGGGASALPVWTTASGSGAPVRATSPTLVTPALGTPTSGTLTNCTADGTNAVGFKEIPQNSQSAAYTLVLTDSGKHILHPSADTTARIFTIPANGSVAYPIWTAVTFVNQNAAWVITISITTDTMRLAWAWTTGSRTLAANGVATAIKLTSTEWIISWTWLT